MASQPDDIIIINGDGTLKFVVGTLCQYVGFDWYE